MKATERFIRKSFGGLSHGSRTSSKPPRGREGETSVQGHVQLTAARAVPESTGFQAGRAAEDLRDRRSRLGLQNGLSRERRPAGLSVFLRTFEGRGWGDVDVVYISLGSYFGGVG